MAEAVGSMRNGRLCNGLGLVNLFATGFWYKDAECELVMLRAGKSSANVMDL